MDCTTIELTIPGLQRVAAQQCVVCGTPADAYCAGCGITPYCSELCQRRDWNERHVSVCHNLARKFGDNQRGIRDVPDIEPRHQPLRRPHAVNNKKRDQRAAYIDNDLSSTSGSSGKNDRLNKPQEARSSTTRDFNQNNDQHSAKNNNNGPKQGSKSTRNMTINKTPRQPLVKPEPQVEEKETEREVKPVVTPPAVAKTKVETPVVQKAKAETPKISLVPTTSAPEPIKTITKESNTIPKPASVTDVTPIKKMLPVLPKHYLIEKLAIGEIVILSVEAKASDSRMTRGDYVCLSMSEAFETQYQSLCEDFVLECDKDETPIKLVPGETCTYFNPEDGGWYRARCLNPTTLALLDSGKIISVTSTDKCRKLPTKYEAIPEFCCVLTFKGVEVGSNLNCKILSKTADGYMVSITNIDNDANLGEGEVSRWLPTIELPPTVSSATIPEVDRPSVSDGSRVVMVLATSLDRVFVRPADSEAQRQYNDALQQVLLCAMNVKPLEQPPQRGQLVIAKFVDGNHYRALVRRTNVKANKYQIEYIEYGNIEVSTLENLYPCPSEVDLTTMPTQVSMVKLSNASTELTPPALAFTDKIKDEEELILTIPDGDKTAPTGTVVNLTMVKNNANINKKLIEMCTPDWKKFEENGGDVIDTAHIMYNDIEYTVLPASGCVLEILDISVIHGGVVSGYDRADQRANNVFNQLTAKMADYCNSELGKEPYLPKPEELCIAQLPPYPQWFRAVFLEQISGPGGSEGRVCYLDYGNIANVPVTLLRKMLPEFVNGYPVMGLHIEIRGFPSDITDEMLARALEFMKIDEEGRGVLKVSNCQKQSNGIYYVDAPELLKYMKG